jgi:hypothetical protein
VLSAAESRLQAAMERGEEDGGVVERSRAHARRDIDLAKTLPAGALTQPPMVSSGQPPTRPHPGRPVPRNARARPLRARARGFTAPRTLTQTCSAAAAPAHEADIQKPMFHTTAACARREPLPIPQRAHHVHV